MVCINCGGNLGVGMCMAMGHVVRGVYDGVLFWNCCHCGFAWPREGFEGPRAVMAQESAEQWNREHDIEVTA